jgi:opacity protein-like surface antigen
MKLPSIPTRQILALAVLGLAAAAPGRAAAQDQKPEWVLSLGGAATGAVPSFSDGWELSVDDEFASVRFAASSDYSPVTSTGLQGTAQVWLPSGFGLFAEVQKESQKLESTQALDLALSFRDCPTCPPFSFNLAGTSDTERFQRDDTRVHLGIGYRLKLSPKVYLEATGGATRFSLDQTLVREFDEDLGGDCLFFAETCTLPVRVAEKERQSDSTWGFNAGAGVTFFFSRNVGLGAGVRYSRGSAVELEGMNAYDEDGGEFRTKVEVRPGGVTANLAMRVRF